MPVVSQQRPYPRIQMIIFASIVVFFGLIGFSMLILSILNKIPPWYSEIGYMLTRAVCVAFVVGIGIYYF